MLRNYKKMAPLLIMLMSGCIKNPLPNPEADILSFTIDPIQLTSATVLDDNNATIQLYLTPEAFDKGIAPMISLSSGATITPSSGDSIFPKLATYSYVVKSESGTGERTYRVEVVNVGTWDFPFERWFQNTDDGYEHPIEDGDIELWSSGNPGVALAGVPKEPSAYPTRSTNDGFNGTKGAELVTIPGTQLSSFIGAYLLAGSFFLGTFNSSLALLSPLQATQFGQPYVGLPDTLRGVYKYAPGARFQDENQQIIPGRTDECSIYAVLYRGPERLDATNVLTSDRVIATAILEDGSAKASFTEFAIPFSYNSQPDSTHKDLMMAIVASSSKEGGTYRGAIGSRLVLDDIRVIPK